jgi:hypothetical protein
MSKKLTLDEVKRKYPQVKQVFNYISDIFKILNSFNGGLLGFDEIYPKYTNQFITRPCIENKINRSAENDRVFPLETMEIQHFNTKHNVDIERAMIHTGPYANEFTRSFNALALTIGYDIFFRDNLYKPSSEEGRKTIVHELTHVNQSYRKDFLLNKNIDVLEEEAEEAEIKETDEEDTVISINLNNNQYVIPKSQINYYAHKVSKYIDKWIKEQKVLLDEEEYLSLLYAYQEWLEG